MKRTCLFVGFLMPHCRRAAGACCYQGTLRFLVEQWTGEGTADTKQAGAGSCSFEPDLQTKVLVRRNHAEYPASDVHSAIAHDDLMIICPDPFLHQLRATQITNATSFTTQ